MLEVNKALIELNGTMAVQVLNFLILVWLMNRIMFRPIDKVITQRETRITAWIEAAQSHRTEMAEMLAEYEAEIDSTTREVIAQQEERKTRVHEEVSKEVQEASKRAAKMVSDAEKELEREAAKAAEELKGQAELFAADMVAKILGREPS